MKLFELFSIGGALYMSIITIWAIAMLVFAGQKIVHFFVQGKFSKSGLDLILLFGSLAFFTGILTQAIGLFQAFGAIQQAGDISPALIYGGFKISMITTLYGFFVFIFSLLVWGILREIYIRKAEN